VPDLELHVCLSTCQREVVSGGDGVGEGRSTATIMVRPSTPLFPVLAVGLRPMHGGTSLRRSHLRGNWYGLKSGGGIDSLGCSKGIPFLVLVSHSPTF
jgi:hypothetical protein